MVLSIYQGKATADGILHPLYLFNAKLYIVLLINTANESHNIDPFSSLRGLEQGNALCSHVLMTS